MQWIANTFQLTPPVVVNDPTKPPAAAQSPDSTWLIPISYYQVFDEFRASSADRAALTKKLAGSVMADADITRLASVDFLWANCLDVLMWWIDTAQTRNWVTTKILAAITGADQAARKIAGGAPVRHILVSHSLGTAATTWALRYLDDQSGWIQRGGFDAWFTLANVAPFVLELPQVYDVPLIPGMNGSLVSGYMYNARQEFDPIPWLLFGRAFDPSKTSVASAQWKDAISNGMYSLVQTKGIAAPKSFSPAISDVHGFANYLMAPEVALPLATFIRGEAFTDAEKTKFNWPAVWDSLPALRCTNDPAAYDKLGAEVKAFVGGQSSTALANAVDSKWIGRLLDALQIVARATGRC